MNRLSFLALLIVPFGMSGCRTPKEEKVSHDEPRLPPRTVRSNCYSLLYDLLGKEKNVSKVLIIKKERSELESLIKQIADTCEAAATQIKNIAKSDASLSLELSMLPPGESATRESIEDARTRQLLHSSGQRFERNLLLTQMESMNYAAHLARVAAIYEPNLEWSRYLQRLAQRFEELHREILGLLGLRWE